MRCVSGTKLAATTQVQAGGARRDQQAVIAQRFARYRYLAHVIQRGRTAEIGFAQVTSVARRGEEPEDYDIPEFPFAFFALALLERSVVFVAKNVFFFP
jgi:hypothetical protein